MACRDETKAVQAVDDIKKSLSTACKVSFMKLDLASLQSVREFAAAFAASKFQFHSFFVAIAIAIIPSIILTLHKKKFALTLLHVQGEPNISPNMKIMISQECADIFVLNFAYLFRRQLRKSVLLCAVFTRHTPN